MDRISTAQAATMPVEFKLNGKTVVGRSDETLIETAKHYGIDIPHLCYKEGMRPTAIAAPAWSRSRASVSRAVVLRYPKDGMEVTTDSARAVVSQKMVLELLLSDIPKSPTRSIPSSIAGEGAEGRQAALRGAPSAEVRPVARGDRGEPGRLYTVYRCLRACREEQVNDVIGYAFRGEHSKIVFDLDDPMGNSTCVACGECVQACPTGALMPAREVGKVVADKTVDSVCPYCGVGCLLTYNVKGNKILWVQGREGPPTPTACA